jgi:GT2 family glycosyltransferase
MKNSSHNNHLDKISFRFVLVLFLFFCLIGGFWGVKGSGTFHLFGFRFFGGGFILIYSFIFLSMILMFFNFPSNKFEKKNVVAILLISLISRGLIFFQDPSDDIFRYIWEGFIFNNGFNPYLFAPNDFVLLKVVKLFPYHSIINHPDIPAGYPPLVILLFSAVAKISISISMFKILVILFDFGAILFLIEILKKRNISIRWSLLYALNPLVLYSFAGGGHIDSVQNFFLLWAVVNYDKKRWVFLFVLAGLAVQIKFVAVIAVPFLLRKENYKYLPVILIPLILPYLPFVEGDPLLLFNGITKFFGEFAFNGPIHMVVRFFSGNMKFATFITKTFFILFYIYGLVKFLTSDSAKDPVEGILYAFTLLLLFTPTLHIWYICWILPFAIVRGVTSWIMLSLTASFYYTTLSVIWFGNEWAMPTWAKFMEWIPFFVCFMFELYYSFSRSFKKNEFTGRCDSLSVVIPVLNEEKKIVNCIENLKKAKDVDEIIVVDGGSIDNTFEVSKNTDVITLINSSTYDKGGGRGGQIRTGIDAANSDIVAVLHSDSLVTETTFSEVKQYLKLNPDVIGGAIGSKFNRSLKMKFIELLNGIRAVFFRISFGDQIQFFRRDVVVNKNLFPNIPLMEDVEFSLRLPKYGRTVFLFGDSTVSTRRWKNKGVKNFFQVLVLFNHYLIKRVFKEPDTVGMYKNYYKQKL